MTISETPASEENEAPPEIPFTPVPRQRRRRNGWSEERQRAFIAALAECGSVARAARSIGMTPRSAYRLLDAAGADSFAAAWDEAIEQGIERVRIAALDRALHGYSASVYRRGKLVRVETRFNDRLAIALLNGRDKSIDAYRRTALSRHKHRQDLQAYDRAKAEEKRQQEEAAAAYRAELEALLQRAEEKRKATLPRITRL